jgi:outer membrane protein assembly factor BamB
MRPLLVRNLAPLVALAASLTSVAGGAGAVAPSGRGPSDVPQVAWFPDGSVDAIARVGRTLYLGGRFDRLVEMGGSLSIHGLGESQPARETPKLWGGSMFAVTPDGRGGFFVGGSFDGADGSSCRGFARVTDAGSVDRAWCGVVNGPVYTTAVAGQRVYVGGAFSRSRGVQRRGLVALDRQSPRVAAWRPSPRPCGIVLAVAVAYGRVYASEAARGCQRVSAYDLRTGRRVWTTNTNGLTSNALAAAHGRLYVGGEFLRIGGHRRRGLAALDARTGRVAAWRADVHDRYGADVYALAVRGTTVFVGGSFETLGNRPRAGLGAVDRDGHVLPWKPLTGDSYVMALHVRGDSVFVAGSFAQLGGARRRAFGAVDAVTGRLEWQPEGEVQHSYVYAISSSEAKVAVGGDAVATGRSIGRRNLAAIDAVTGLPLPWSPRLDGDVSALVADESSVYVGGNFTHEGARNLVALSPAASASLRWRGDANGPVRALALANGTLFVGGRFSTIGGAARGRLAAIDVDNGRVQPWAPAVGEQQTAVRTIAVGPTSVFVGGTFATAGGAPHTALARVDRRTGTVLPWDARVRVLGEFPVEALVLDGDTLYVGGAFGVIGGRERSCIAALDTDSAAVRAWAPRLEVIVKEDLGVSDDCTVDAIGVTASEVVFGGAISFVGDRPHVGLAAVDRRSGAPLPWRPSTGCRARFDVGFPSVGALIIADHVAHVGGSFTPTGCESPEVGLMLFPLPNVGG